MFLSAQASGGWFLLLSAAATFPQIGEPEVNLDGTTSFDLSSVSTATSATSELSENNYDMYFALLIVCVSRNCMVQAINGSIGANICSKKIVAINSFD